MVANLYLIFKENQKIEKMKAFVNKVKNKNALIWQLNYPIKKFILFLIFIRLFNQAKIII